MPGARKVYMAKGKREKIKNMIDSGCVNRPWLGDPRRRQRVVTTLKLKLGHLVDELAGGRATRFRPNFAVEVELVNATVCASLSARSELNTNLKRNRRPNTRFTDSRMLISALNF